MTLASAGTASLLTGYGLVIARANAGDDWVADSISLDAFGKWTNLQAPIILTGAAGGALLTAAMPLALPYRAKPPWWAWMSGGFGVGLAVGALVFGTTADPKPVEGCQSNAIGNSEPCVARAKRTDLAIMLGATAAPLLTVPLVYLFRRSDKRPETVLSPSVQLARTGAMLRVRGTF